LHLGLKKVPPTDVVIRLCDFLQLAASFLVNIAALREASLVTHCGSYISAYVLDPTGRRVRFDRDWPPLSFSVGNDDLEDLEKDDLKFVFALDYLPFLTEYFELAAWSDCIDLNAVEMATNVLFDGELFLPQFATILQRYAWSSLPFLMASMLSMGGQHINESRMSLAEYRLEDAGYDVSDLDGEDLIRADWRNQARIYCRLLRELFDFGPPAVPRCHLDSLFHTSSLYARARNSGVLNKVEVERKIAFAFLKELQGQVPNAMTGVGELLETAVGELAAHLASRDDLSRFLEQRNISEPKSLVSIQERDRFLHGAICRCRKWLITMLNRDLAKSNARWMCQRL